MENFVNKIRGTVKHWYLFLIIGILFLFTGFYTLSQPMSAYVALSVLFSVTFLFSGVARIAFSISNRKHLHNWGWGLAYGVIVTILGILLVSNPFSSMATLALFVGFITLMYSLNTVIYSFELKDYGIKNWGWSLVFGIISLIFSIMMIARPGFAADFIVIFTGLSFIFLSFGYMVYAFRLRKLKKVSKRIPEELRERLDTLLEEVRSRMS